MAKKFVRAVACEMRQIMARAWVEWFPKVAAKGSAVLRSLDLVVRRMQASRSARTVTAIFLILPVYLVGTAASPGLYTVDSKVQLGEAVSGEYYDWSPPVMSALWSKLIAVTGTPESLLWLHLALLVTGLLLWYSAARRARKSWAVLFLVMSAFGPQLLNFAGVLWKDVGFAMAMFAAFAVAIHKERKGVKAVLSAAVILMLAFYAVGVRVNGFPAVLPLLFVVARGHMSGRGWRGHLMVGGTAVAGTLLLITLNWGLSYRILDAHRTHPEQYIQLYDLAGISVRTGEDRLPDSYKNSEYTFARMAEAYKPNSGNYLFWVRIADDQTPLKLEVRRVDDPLSRAELRHAWKTAIAESPIAYLSHRTEVFFSLMRIGYDHGYGWFVQFSEKPAESVWPGNQAIARFLRRQFFSAEKHTVLYFGWFWFVVLTISTGVGYVYRKEPLARVATAQAVSGILYILPYYFIAPASDFRYLYWSVIAGTVSGAILSGLVAQDLVRQYGQPRLISHREGAVTESNRSQGA